MVNPKKNLLMGLEVTEGSQKKAKNGQDSLVCFPCCDGQKEPPEKNLSWWWLQRRHSQGANGAAGWDPSTEPCPAAALDKAGQASLHFLPALLHHLVPGSSTQGRFSESFPTPWACVEKRNHHRSVHVFRKRSKTGTAKAGNLFLLYCHDSGRGPDRLEKLGLPSLQISTDYLVSSEKPKKQQIKSTSQDFFL